ncbi:hypothetical protein HDC37_000041 [Microbacterium sp. AK009]|uniref:hypothetical protein n=1 Tax=Microbacterium sp. AK009 TaxID=2723068 RepID=UPI0015C97250|nr:hypothetical protein [Microbacterium sp. AK009]NYF15229.1 hypothetical protein [Microbacterium sp. AK009]
MPFAVALTVLLVLLGAFQLALAAGAPLGRFAWGGQHLVLPTRLRIGSVVSILIYAVIVLLAWSRVGAIDLFPRVVSEVGLWVVFGYFALGIVMNALSRSRPERFTMTPVCLVLAVLSFFIAMGFDDIEMETLTLTF